MLGTTNKFKLLQQHWSSAEEQRAKKMTTSEWYCDAILCRTRFTNAVKFKATHNQQCLSSLQRRCKIKPRSSEVFTQYRRNVYRLIDSHIVYVKYSDHSVYKVSFRFRMDKRTCENSTVFYELFLQSNAKWNGERKRLLMSLLPSHAYSILYSNYFIHRSHINLLTKHSNLLSFRQKTAWLLGQNRLIFSLLMKHFSQKGTLMWFI